MIISKKMWQKPEMVVLVRSNPEERVLDFCKGGVRSGPDVSPGTSCRDTGTPCDTISDS